jgi:hypothetical protein
MRNIFLFFFLLPVLTWGQTPFQLAQNEANAEFNRRNLREDIKRNIDIDPVSNVIHIFVYEDGRVLRKGFPTTATEQNTFMVHMIYDETHAVQFDVSFSGTYSPTLNIVGAQSVAALARGVISMKTVSSAVFGPYTGTVNITITEIGGANRKQLVSANISIAKTVHVSIGSGLVYSSLRSPSNMKKIPATLGSTDSVIVADDPNGRGLLTLFATFYPFGRNSLMLNSTRFRDRFGILIGTTIGAETGSFRDALLGMQYDFAVGGAVVAGAHYGRRLRIHDIDYRDFEFGKTIYTGKLQEQQYYDWDFGFFVGVQVDSRIFGNLFKK